MPIQLVNILPSKISQNSYNANTKMKPESHIPKSKSRFSSKILCSVCPDHIFFDIEEFIKHVNTHLDQKGKYPCNECKLQIFNDRQSLLTHKNKDCWGSRWMSIWSSKVSQNLNWEPSNNSLVVQAPSILHSHKRRLSLSCENTVAKRRKQSKNDEIALQDTVTTIIKPTRLSLRISSLIPPDNEEFLPVSPKPIENFHSESSAETNMRHTKKKSSKSSTSSLSSSSLAPSDNIILNSLSNNCTPICSSGSESPNLYTFADFKTLNCQDGSITPQISLTPRFLRPRNTKLLNSDDCDPQNLIKIDHLSLKKSVTISMEPSIPQSNSLSAKYTKRQDEPSSTNISPLKTRENLSRPECKLESKVHTEESINQESQNENDFLLEKRKKLEQSKLENSSESDYHSQSFSSSKKPYFPIKCESLTSIIADSNEKQVGEASEIKESDKHEKTLISMKEELQNDVQPSTKSPVLKLNITPLVHNETSSHKRVSIKSITIDSHTSTKSHKIQTNKISSCPNVSIINWNEFISNAPKTTISIKTPQNSPVSRSAEGPGVDDLKQSIPIPSPHKNPRQVSTSSTNSGEDRISPRKQKITLRVVEEPEKAVPIESSCQAFSADPIRRLNDRCTHCGIKASDDRLYWKRHLLYCDKRVCVLENPEQFYHCSIPNCPLTFGRKNEKTNHEKGCIYSKIKSQSINTSIQSKRNLSPIKNARPSKRLKSNTPVAFQCPACGETFKKTEDLYTHVLKPHLKRSSTANRLDSYTWPSLVSSRFGCPICGLSFPSESRLEKHRRGLHTNVR